MGNSTRQIAIKCRNMAVQCSNKDTTFVFYASFQQFAAEPTDVRYILDPWCSLEASKGIFWRYVCECMCLWADNITVGVIVFVWWWWWWWWLSKHTIDKRTYFKCVSQMCWNAAASTVQFVYLCWCGVWQQPHNLQLWRSACLSLLCTDCAVRGFSTNDNVHWLRWKYSFCSNGRLFFLFTIFFEDNQRVFTIRIERI